MPIRFGKNSVMMEDVCTVEDALPLLEYLQRHAQAKVTLRSCTLLHSAVLQVLMALRPKIAALPEEPFLRRWVAPLLADPAP